MAAAAVAFALLCCAFAALITTGDVCSRLAHKSFHTQRGSDHPANWQTNQPALYLRKVHVVLKFELRMRRPQPRPRLPANY